MNDDLPPAPLPSIHNVRDIDILTNYETPGEDYDGEGVEGEESRRRIVRTQRRKKIELLDLLTQQLDTLVLCHICALYYME
jgi:hypothetical protein